MSMASHNSTEEIARAEAQVLERKAALTRSLRAARRSGEVLYNRVQRELQPALKTAAVLAGAAGVIGLALLVRSRQKRAARWLPPAAQPSLLTTVAKTAGIWAFRRLARYAAVAAVKHWSEPPARPLGLLPSSVALSPNQVER
jgi:hypothetical protein